MEKVYVFSCDARGDLEGGGGGESTVEKERVDLSDHLFT